MKVLRNDKQINRWNVILGKADDNDCCGAGGENCCDAAQVLDYIYDRGRIERGERAGGKEQSQLTVPEWIIKAKACFPEKGFDVIVKDAVHKFNMAEVLFNDDVVDKIIPDEKLLRDVLSFKNVLNPELMPKVRRLIAKAADILSEKIKKEISPSLNGYKRSFKRGYLKKINLLDIKKTITKNLKTYNPDSKTLCPTEFIFKSNQKKRESQTLILVVDQSGSMVDSVINTAVVASILYNTSFLNVHIVLFDTAVVDVTEKCNDLTELLLSVQLGGGTNIGKALSYANSLIKTPKKTLVVLVSDLCEGASYPKMYIAAKKIIEGGSKLLCLAALDYNNNLQCDKTAAQHLCAMGAGVEVQTPGGLTQWIAKQWNC